MEMEIQKKTRKMFYSYGLIAVTKKHEVLMVCRKDSIGFVEFIKGKYSYNKYSKNNIYIEDLFHMMTKEELYLLSNYEYTYEQAYKRLWNCNYNDNVLEKDSVYKYKHKHKGLSEKEKFEKKDLWLHLCKNIHNNGRGGWNDAEWGFPKGKKESKESGLKCAIREFVEETGISPEFIDINIDINCDEGSIEHFCEKRTEGDKMFIYNYYLVYLKEDFSELLINKQDREISKIRLVPICEAFKLIRPYFKSRLNVLHLLEKKLFKN